MEWEYSCFEEIEPPTAAVLQWQNPSLTLDYNRYASESTVDYVRFQEQIIRELAPDALITTNNWLCENMPDFYDMFETLDVVSTIIIRRLHYQKTDRHYIRMRFIWI